MGKETMGKIKTVVIIPTYNEKGNVEPVVKALSKIFRSLGRYECLILFVDDNSPDGTSREINKEMRKFPFIKLLKNHQKGGLGHAYKAGMRYALDKLKAEILFEFDADLQHDPTRIPVMLRAIEDGADLVLGSRYIKGGGIPRTWGLHRKFLSVFGNLFISFVMLNFKVRDWTTGYRAIRAEVVTKVLPLLGGERFSGYTFQIGFLIKALQNKFRITEVPFLFHDRTIGRSKLGPEYIVNNLIFILKLRAGDFMNSRIIKFVMVGGFGALVQFTALTIYRKVLPFQLAFFLSIETSIVSNFILSNLWTFADRKLKAIQIPLKFLEFNLSSGGSILIQQAIAFVGENLIGLFPLFILPIIKFQVDTGLMYAVTGIFVGMFWNFFAYNKFIWKKK